MTVPHQGHGPSREAQVAFTGEVRRWASRIGVEPRQIRIQRMTRKWASCSPASRVSFSADLLSEDAKFRELVIVHELLHLRVPNHGRLFRGLLKAYLPWWDGRSDHRCLGS